MSGLTHIDRQRVAGLLRSDSEALESDPLLAQPEMLSEQVYRAIVQMLAQGSLRRGETLRIEFLSRALGVSATPVREALARLATTGLIVHEARRGYRIAPPLTLPQLKDLMDARRLIETGAIRLACRNGGEAFAAELSAAFAAQSATVGLLQTTDPADPTERAALEWKVLEADLGFHNVIFDSTRNPFVRVMAEALSAQIYRIRQSTEHGLSDADQALTEHRTILDAVAANDPVGAERAMLSHVDLIERRAAADLSRAENSRSHAVQAREPEHRR